MKATLYGVSCYALGVVVGAVLMATTRSLAIVILVGALAGAVIGACAAVMKLP